MSDVPRTVSAIGSRVAFQQAVRDALRDAADAGCRALWLCDADFAAWPLGERAVVDTLTRWVGSQRRLTLVASRFDAVTRLHPRWVGWRRDWAHVVDCRTDSEREAGDWPTVVLATGVVSVVLDDPVAFRGRLSREPADAAHARERLDALLRRSVPAFPPDVTGL